jgi:hypothetical protein
MTIMFLDWQLYTELQKLRKKIEKSLFWEHEAILLSIQTSPTNFLPSSPSPPLVLVTSLHFPALAFLRFFYPTQLFPFPPILFPPILFLSLSPFTSFPTPFFPNPSHTPILRFSLSGVRGINASHLYSSELLSSQALNQVY